MMPMTVKELSHIPEGTLLLLRTKVRGFNHYNAEVVTKLWLCQRFTPESLASGRRYPIKLRVRKQDGLEIEVFPSQVSPLPEKGK